jgi:hypothetical protein
MVPPSNGVPVDRCACGYALIGTESGRCPECGRNISGDGSPPIATYRERRFGIRRDFTLYQDRVMVLSRNWSGTGVWLPVRLDELSLSTTTAWIRSPMSRQCTRLLNGALTITGLAIWWQLVYGFTLRVTIACGILLLPGIALMLATYRAAEFVRFHMKEYREKVLLDIARAGPDSARFDELVGQIKSTIETSKYRNGDWVMMVSKEKRT